MHYFPAPAKINLFLRVVNRAPSGYHCLQTVFQFIDLTDQLGFELLDDNIVLCDYHNDTITPANDLILKAIELLRAETQTKKGVSIHLKKHIPSGAGLGGGSSNAATTLVALNHLWDLGISRDRLQILGKQLGADVPVFIYGKSAWAEGIGDELYPIAPTMQPYLLVIPPISISTRTIFTSPYLSRNNPKLSRETLPAYFNDCTGAIFTHYPMMKTYIDQLIERSFAPRITGTGACLYLPEPTHPDQYNAFIDYCQQAGLRWLKFSTLNDSPLYQSIS